jgi:hypothetical protein
VLSATNLYVGGKTGVSLGVGLDMGVALIDATSCTPRDLTPERTFTQVV